MSVSRWVRCVCVCVVTSQAVLDSSLTRAISGEGQIHKLLSANSHNSWGWSTGQVEGVGWDQWCRVEGASKASRCWPWSWIPGLPPVRHPALSFISTYWPGGVQIHRPCGLQVAIISWDLAENSTGPQVWPVLQPLRVPGLGPSSPSLPPSLSHSLTVWTLLLLQDREALTALRTFLGEQGEWG